jgi:hypothetical protein
MVPPTRKEPKAKRIAPADSVVVLGLGTRCSRLLSAVCHTPIERSVRQTMRA